MALPFILGASQAPVLCVGMLPFGCAIMCSMLDAELFLQPHLEPQSEHTLPQL